MQQYACVVNVYGECTCADVCSCLQVYMDIFVCMSTHALRHNRCISMGSNLTHYQHKRSFLLQVKISLCVFTHTQMKHIKWYAHICMCASKGCLKFQEISKSLQTTHIYFYCFNHIIGGVGMWSAKCVSKYFGRFGQSRFEINDLGMFPQKTDE